MRGNEIDACGGIPVIVFIKVGTAGKAFGKFSQHTIGPAPVIAHTIPVFAIPFSPARRKLTDLITSFAYVPGFGYQFHLRDNRVLVDDIKKSAQPVDVVQLAGQGSRQVEPEAV